MRLIFCQMLQQGPPRLEAIGCQMRVRRGSAMTLNSRAAYLVIVPCNLCQSLQRNYDNICVFVRILYLPQQCFNLQESASEAFRIIPKAELILHLLQF